MKKLDIGVIVTTLIIVTISCSLAFFAARVVGEPKDINLVAKNVAITFNDTSIIANGVVSPGWNTTKTFTITNNSKEEYKYNISIKDLINTFVTEGYLQYKITSTNGYNMIEYKDIPKSSASKDTILAYSVSIPVGVTQSYTIEFKYANDESIDQSDDMGRKLSGTLFITEGTEDIYAGYEEGTLGYQIMGDNPTRDTRDTYDAVFTNNTTGTLFTATENNVHNTTDTTVYYYAGNTTNNWVKFGGYYWRIIRTNADGSVRILYSGTATDTSSGYLSTGDSAFNTSSNSPKYAGYMYGENDDTLVNARTNTNNSTIKKAIDNWYASNMTSYTKYLSTTAVYCNDRSLGTNQTSGTYNTGSTNFNYAPSARAYTSYDPTYDCTEASDAFSVDNTSAKLTYPIALMTVDEIMRAGGKDDNLTSPYAWYYLNSANGSITGDNDWWLLSPGSWTDSVAYVFNVSGSSGLGLLYGYNVDFSQGVRPAVSLKSCTKWASGDGSSSNPYTIKETETGC